MNYEQWLISIGKSPKTAKNYAGAIAGGLSKWAMDEGLANLPLYEFTAVEEFFKVASGIRQLAIYDARNTRGKGMYNAALNTYADFLSDVTQNALESDLAGIVEDGNLSDTEKATLVNTRIGQGRFRRQLLQLWGGCAVTGYRDSRFLVASHIKPWSKSDNRERLDPFNGLLLLPNLDRVFDLGYISFDASGKIRVSKELETLETLGIDYQMQATLTSEHQIYLEYHRDEVFRR